MKLRQRRLALPLAAAVCALSFVFASPATAATLIAIDDPSTVGVDVILDDTDFDGSVSTGGALSVGAFPVTFAFGVGNTAASRMDLAAIVGSFDQDASLNLLFTQTDFSGDVTALASITGLSAGELVYAAYYDLSNTPFGFAHLIGGPLGLGPGSLLGSTSGAIVAGGSYSLTQAISLRHPAGQPSATELTASIEVTPTVVPEPATMTLFGLGLSGAAWMRRRRVENSPT